MKLIVDTDIGTDADDAIALVYAIRKGIDIPLITTVHGDTLFRARVAKKLTALCGRTIPVIAGEKNPIRQKQIYSSGIEDKAFVGDTAYDSSSNAIDEIIRTVHQYAGDIAIAAIGPLTNIARAIQKDPGLPKLVNHLYVMGNAICAQERYYLNYRAHNFKVDPEAVDIALLANIPTTIITTEVAKMSSITAQDIEGLAKSKNAALEYIARAATAWNQFIGHDVAYLYDPLVIQHHVDPLVTKKRLYGSVTITTDVVPSFAGTVLKQLLEE